MNTSTTYPLKSYCSECVISNQRPITLVKTIQIRKKILRFLMKMVFVMLQIKIKNEIDWDEREKELISL